MIASNSVASTLGGAFLLLSSVSSPALMAGEPYPGSDQPFLTLGTMTIYNTGEEKQFAFGVAKQGDCVSSGFALAVANVANVQGYCFDMAAVKKAAHDPVQANLEASEVGEGYRYTCDAGLDKAVTARAAQEFYAQVPDTDNPPKTLNLNGKDIQTLCKWNGNIKPAVAMDGYYTR